MLLGLAVLAALWLVGRASNPGPIGLRLDDAWIHLVYGRGLLENGFPAYNPGEPATGCTSWAWAVCLAALHAGFGHGDLDRLLASVFALGVALHGFVILASAALAYRVTSSRVGALAAGAAVALATPFALAAFSGMEVTLTALLLVLVTHAAISGRWRLAGWLGAGALLARPEAGSVLVALAVLGTWRTLRGAGARRAAGDLARLLVPACAVVAGIVAYDLWASGRPLPATFYAKSSGGLFSLPTRAWSALAELLSQVPPFAGGLGWLALLGYVTRPRRADALSFAPLAGGVAYTAANLIVVDPVDPAAFYHLRYVLPAVPLLLVGLVRGALLLAEALPRRARWAPLALVASCAVVGAALTLAAESRHFHNDVRNINEVQRRIGTWLEQATPEGAWIAASDAGAIRYCSNRPTVDVIGLNTPEMLQVDDAYLREHPVAAVALIPTWFRARDAESLAVAFRAESPNYTVTSNPRMGTQVVLVPARAATGERVRARFSGFHTFEIEIDGGMVSAGP